MVSKKQILDAKHCEEIFSNNLDETKKLYKELVKEYHPDVNRSNDAQEVFMKVQALYNETLSKLGKGIWEVKNQITLKTTNGKTIVFKYLSDRPFELGMIYVGRQHILYQFNSVYKKYFDNALKMIKSIRYADSKMEKEFKRMIPRLVSSYQTVDNTYIMVIEKDLNEYMLSDVKDKCASKLTDRHIAWMLSRLNNLNCFLSYNGIVLNGVNTDNCFINPLTHSLSIYGGWWYATLENEKMLGTTKEIFNVMPIKNKTEKIALHTTDAESIRLLANKLLYNKSETPKAFLDWLQAGSVESAFDEFDRWNQTLDKAYGKRVFMDLDISSEDIY